MRRFPPYMIIAVCGILFLSAGMVIITADSTDPAAQPTAAADLPTPTQVVSAPVEQPAQPVVIPTDVPPATAQPVVQPTEVVAVPVVIPTDVPPVEQPTDVVVVPVIVPTDVVQPGQPTATVEQQVIPTTVDQTLQPQPTNAVVLPATAIPVGGGGGGGDNGGVVLTLVIPKPNQPLGTLPSPPTALPTAVNPVVIPTQALSSSPAIAQVAGQVGAPLRADYAGIVVKLTLADGSTVQTTTDSSGHFVFPNLTPGTYRLDAGAAGYLSSQTTVTVTQGQSFVLPPVMLVGGDTNLDNKIDLTDAALIAANFDSSSVVAGSDLNHDGVVDIRDLTAIGAYFGRTGPTPWQPQ